MAASRFECPRCQTMFVKDIGDAAFVECPSCGALALPAGDATEGYLERALSGTQEAPGLSTTLPSTEAEQPAASDLGGAAGSGAAAGFAQGIFSGLLDAENGGGIVIPPASLPSSSSSSPSPSSSSGGRGAELDFDFGSLDVELPSAPPTTPPSGARGPSRSSSSVDPFGRAGARGGPIPMPPVTQLPPEALAALAQEADAGPTDVSQPAPWSGLSEDAFGDLEKAFDEMALKPAPAPRGRLSAEEERFLRSDGPAARPPPLRRNDERTARNGEPPSRPPPRRGGAGSGAARGGPRPRPTHFELSEEARSLAFIALKADDANGAVVRPRMDARRDVGGGARESGRGDGREGGAAVDARASGGRGPSSGRRAEDGDLARGERERPAKKPVPSAFQGLSALRVLALVVGCGVLGGVAGALTAPPPKPAATARARAELRFADGNRFYDAGRYDDALGAFRGALSIDPTFGLAHRAKGAALAKLQRFDEAADAYEEYLKLEPDAVDIGDVKAAITRRGPPPGEAAP